MNLSHFSSRIVTQVLSVEPGHREGAYLMSKPRGFWVSVDGKDDWPSWVNGEYPDKDGMGSGWHERLQYRHRVVLKKDARIALLTNAFEMDLFTEKYGEVIRSAGMYYSDIVMNWTRIGGEFSGIIVAPYIWSRRLHDDYSWYYPWDCASGCIWDASCIEQIELVTDVGECHNHTAPATGVTDREMKNGDSNGNVKEGCGEDRSCGTDPQSAEGEDWTEVPWRS